MGCWVGRVVAAAVVVCAMGEGRVAGTLQGWGGWGGREFKGHDMGARGGANTAPESRRP